MEFHLPFFALRKATNSDSSLPAILEKTLRKWEYLDLLGQHQSGSVVQEKYRLHQALQSCVVHGFDEWQWITYSFEDNQHENNPDDEDDVAGDHQLNSNDVTFDEDDEDPILHHLDSHTQPLWRPRQFFLKAFEMQVRKFWLEWNSLVHKLEDDRSEYVSLFDPTLAPL